MDSSPCALAPPLSTWANSGVRLMASIRAIKAGSFNIGSLVSNVTPKSMATKPPICVSIAGDLTRSIKKFEFDEVMMRKCASAAGQSSTQAIMARMNATITGSSAFIWSALMTDLTSLERRFSMGSPGTGVSNGIFSNWSCTPVLDEITYTNDMAA